MKAEFVVGVAVGESPIKLDGGVAGKRIGMLRTGKGVGLGVGCGERIGMLRTGKGVGRGVCCGIAGERRGKLRIGKGVGLGIGDSSWRTTVLRRCGDATVLHGCFPAVFCTTESTSFL